jgi:thymidylate synthase ThyX
MTQLQLNISNPDLTGLTIVSLLDSKSQYTLRTALSNPTKQSASIMAFTGARFSRSNLSAEELFTEINSSGKSASEKLANIFRNYGHASVADMANLFAYIENIPQKISTKFFYETAIGGGQERSTRYQDFSNLQVVSLIQQSQIDLAKLSQTEKEKLTSLDEKYQYLQKLSLEKYTSWNKKLYETYKSVYQVDENNKQQLSALNARVFDCSRYFLPFGACNRTSICWVTNAREWARLISLFKGDKSIENQSLGNQLEQLFAPSDELIRDKNYLPEASDLIKYTNANESTKMVSSNLEKLLIEMDFANIYKKIASKDFCELSVTLLNKYNTNNFTLIVSQFILTLYPNCDIYWLLNWINNLDQKAVEKLSKIIFENFDHHQQMSNICKTNVFSFLLYGSIGEMRDFNRHRAWGRFTPILNLHQNYDQLLDYGFNMPLYLTQNPDLKHERIEFENDLKQYYVKLKEFIKEVISTNPAELDFLQQYIIDVLPFAQIMPYIMHGSIKEVSYLTKLRVRTGGHINYRQLAYLMSQEIASFDPAYKVLNSEIKQPNPSSREEFLDRS